ncbi:uncharacterized protein EV420DRAFT_1506918 [Desarmillaria tabescens]|uniref:Uncharacterized protein n=1 Tax=Armillaria tabescens TaxID=1929756 RepID=A0AA39TQK6_ARMTA|nr:uncharacterized protein EV420DRAFT_1506918 [Desarmillaria tabescens]KAK0467052.1 hypothetical protein EV420DRAFT_1506918 [Desarmillaria tabescens]
MSTPPVPFYGDLNFASDKSAPGAFAFPFVTCVSSGEPLHLSPHRVQLHDLREEEQRPSLDVEGFTWQTVPFEGLDGEEGWEERYAKETCEWLKKHTGAKDCKAINYQIRAADGESRQEANYAQDSADQVLGKQPVPAVHYEEDPSAAKAERVAISVSLFNVWRPLRGPVMDAPLAVCDARTLDPKDMTHTIDKYGGGYFIKYNANMKWMYIRDQMPDEILVFRQFDSTLIPAAGDAACIAHTGL